MKTKLIILVCLGVMLSNSLKAQKISLSDRASLVLPVSSKKMTSTSATGFAKSNNIKLTEMPEGENKTIYVSDNVIITLMASQKPGKVDLVQLKKTMDEMAKSVTTYSSKIVNVKGNKFLLIEYVGISKIRFFSTNAAGTSSVNGILDFNETNRSKASAQLENVMENISFGQ